MQFHDPNCLLPQPWDRIFPLITRLTVWGILAGIIYLLKSFFLLILLTFVFTYIQASGVERLAPVFRNRTLRVVVVTMLFLGLLTGTGLFVFPKVKDQATLFVNQFSSYIRNVDDTLLNLGTRYPILYDIIPELKHVETTLPDIQGNIMEIAKKSPTTRFLQDLAGMGQEADGYKNIDLILNLLRDIGGQFMSVASAFLLALLFSFLILLDLPNLARSVSGLQHTRLRFIYDEVAPNIREFSHVLGQAMEAQFLISMVNTLFTAAGLYLLGLGANVAFLSVIVFFCSFIPVIGVFISSAPICLIALQGSGGIQTLVLAIILIIVIHLIEGYILNPKIYGTRMHINPVVVLIILTVCGKLFHIWGLILGVPACTYFFGHAIRETPKPVPDPLPKKV